MTADRSFLKLREPCLAGHMLLRSISGSKSLETAKPMCDLPRGKLRHSATNVLMV